MQAEKPKPLRHIRRKKRPAGRPATPAQYLDFEYAAKRKHEYAEGEIRLMAYTSENHGLLVANLIGLLFAALKGTGCRVYPSDRLLHIPATGAFYYPDVMIVCGESDFFNYKQTMKATLNPTTLIEVMSVTTSDYDETVKWWGYRRISTVQQYVRVSQNEYYVELYTRTNDSTEWLNTYYTEPDQTLTINGVVLRVADVYENVVL